MKSKPQLNQIHLVKTWKVAYALAAKGIYHTMVALFDIPIKSNDVAAVERVAPTHVIYTQGSG